MGFGNARCRRTVLAAVAAVVAMMMIFVSCDHSSVGQIERWIVCAWYLVFPCSHPVLALLVVVLTPRSWVVLCVCARGFEPR
jgi:hypothetical protein